jgi:hypothetical protein
MNTGSATNQYSAEDKLTVIEHRVKEVMLALAVVAVGYFTLLFLLAR